ncbi:hypothetical protein FO470_17700 [Starkeya sp. 3C]|uniref:Mitochondrial inner membrane protein n=1 Tax=Ancylobacter moscoviensis TaxID=2597768 RepID=A0ABY3DMU6_9HYPH|nr:hypothetical protein [Ancylobacter moscoviensis]TSJ60577.1 hypothetical protein FO470_17700 [Ancylobacter moscoviensis]
MAKDDPTSGAKDKAGTGGKPSRRAPPTLDLSAKDVTPVSDDAATAEPLPGENAKPADDGGVPAESASAESTPGDAASAAGDVPVLDVEAEPETQNGRPGDAAPEPRPERRLGLIGGIVAGLVSGVIGGAVAFALVSAFYGADQNVDAITELEARALDLRQRVEVLESRAGEASALDASAPQELATRLDALESGLDALGRKVETLPAPAPAEGAAPTAAVSVEDVAGLANRVGALEGRVTAIPAPVVPPPAASPADLDAARSRIAALEERLDAVATAQKASGQGAAQLVALRALRDAVASGRPFAMELKASRALLGAEGAPLATLEPAAAEGFPSASALAARLKTATAPAETAPAPATAEGGVVERLMRSAQGLVSVRRSDDAAASPGLARAEAALARGDFAGAKAALAALPETERAAAQPVIAVLDARQAALDAIAGIDQHVLATLGGGAQ